MRVLLGLVLALAPAWIRRACLVLLLVLVPGLTFGPLDRLTFGPLDPCTLQALTIDDIDD